VPALRNEPTAARRPLAAPLRALWPLASTLGLFGWLHTLHIWHVRDQVDLLPIVAGFAPLLLVEVWLGGRFAGQPPRALLRTPRGRLETAGNLAFWTLGFLVWVVLVGDWSRTAQWLRWFGPDFHLQLWLVLRAEGWLTGVALLAWGGSYAWWVARRRRYRLVASLLVPVVLSVALFAHLTFGGGVGALDIEEVTAQSGVELALDPRTLHIEGDAPSPHHAGPILRCSTSVEPPPIVRTVPYRWHPRDVIATEDALIVSYGCSFCLVAGLPPSILRIDRKTDAISCFRSGNLHHIDVVAERDRVWAAPWTSRDIYALKLGDLSVDFTVAPPPRGQMRFFQPIQVLEDARGTALYAGTELEATLVKFDIEARAYEAKLRLADLGLVSWGGPLHFLEQHPETRRLYFTSGPGHNLFEVDPDTMTVLRSLDLEDVVGTALLLDASRGVLYYQSGVRDALHAIDLDSWTVARTYDGEIHARRLALDASRRALYVLGHLSGQVFALDLETGARAWTRSVGGRPHGLSRDGDTLWVNSFAGLFRLHLPTLWGDPVPEEVNP